VRPSRASLAVGCAVAQVWLLCVASASASRRPTPSERAAITRVAAATRHAGPGTIYVEGVWVSTVGPWATAKNVLYVGGGDEYAFEILHKVNGRWRLTRHSPGTSGEQCGIGMPRADQVNLGFAACPLTQLV
jgi:hypothetical protein